jgi:hypothetical protein
MQRTILVLFTVLSLTSFNAYAAAQARSGKANCIEDRVIIQRRRIVLIRSPKLARQFPGRKSAVVTYPVISGLNDAVVLRRVRSALSKTYLTTH